MFNMEIVLEALNNIAECNAITNPASICIKALFIKSVGLAYFTFHYIKSFVIFIESK